MTKKIVSVFNYTPPKMEDISDDEVYLLGMYIDVLSLQYGFSEIQTSDLNVQEFKKKNNAYLKYLETTITKLFSSAHDQDPERTEELFKKKRIRNKFQVDQFLKDMCNGE